MLTASLALKQKAAGPTGTRDSTTTIKTTGPRQGTRAHPAVAGSVVRPLDYAWISVIALSLLCPENITARWLRQEKEETNYGYFKKGV